MSEIWLPVVGYEGYYSISNQGRIRSEDRIVHYPDKRRSRLQPGRILKPGKVRGDYLHVVLSVNGHKKDVRIHQVVMEAFEGPMPEGSEVLHWDDDPTNNAYSNLRYGSRSDNRHDCIRNGNDHNAKRITCNNGHNNWKSRPGESGRRCATCDRDYHREYKRRWRKHKREQERLNNIEAQLNTQSVA